MRELGRCGGVHCTEREMLEPAAAFLMYVDREMPRRVGFPLSSQSAMYSVRPMGMPLTPRRSSSSASEAGEWEEGKVVDIVARGVRFRIRRPRTADS